MELQRVLLYSALALTLFMLWQAWQNDYGPHAPAPNAQIQAPAAPDLPGAPAEPKPAEQPLPSAPTLASGSRITVHTDVFSAEIDTTGGDLRRVDLLHYPISSATPDQPVRLLNDSGEIFVAQSGLLPASNTPVALAPTHHTVFTSPSTDFTLKPGQESLEVPLRWTSPEGVIVDKIFVFHRNDYVVDVKYVVHNSSTAPWSGHMYRQLVRTKPTEENSGFLYTYTGGAIFSPEKKYEKIKFDSMTSEPLSREIQDGWAAMIQHYFLAAWIPPQEDTSHYYTKAAGENRFIIGMVGPVKEVAVGANGEFGSRLYVGPKLQDRLEALSPGLELTADYGMLTFIAKPLFWLLKVIHSVIGNWGWAIVFLTLLIKIAFYKLSATSYRSMAQIRKMQPRLVAIKERYADDRQKLNEAMMALYKEEKINPLGGCLPVLVQIPVFIALYWVLLETVEMRQAPFILWIHDLSIADPYFVLPILMGATMLVQHRLNPTPMDPIQAKVMMILPIIFTFFFAFFPAGLVLYWVVNNALSILQQWLITRGVVEEKGASAS